MAAGRMREWSCDGSALARCPNRRRKEKPTEANSALHLIFSMLFGHKVISGLRLSLKVDPCWLLTQKLPLKVF